MNNLLKKKTLDSILSGFTKVVEDLRVLQGKNQEEYAKKSEEVHKLQNQMFDLQNESDRALKVQEKIKTLLE